ncbi:hypothetical protein V8G54_028322 [Vigna mungo]|uniref:Hexosyltransferase n=1 Tax=Vigna mungo TaxID=3915 RepID=A0AAQ3MSC4_VIGMU
MIARSSTTLVLPYCHDPRLRLPSRLHRCRALRSPSLLVPGKRVLLLQDAVINLISSSIRLALENPLRSSGTTLYSLACSLLQPCYFNTGVMVMDLVRWREGNYRKRIENWMELQRKKRIYDYELDGNAADADGSVDLSHPDAELRLLEVFYHKIYKMHRRLNQYLIYIPVRLGLKNPRIFHVNERIENINDQYWALRAEEIPEEEKNLGPQHRLIHVYHFLKDTNQKQQVQNFGHPFFLVIHEGETLAEVKLRIQKKLQVPDEEFSKWRFAFLSFGRPEYLQDSDIVSTRFQRRDIYGAWEQYLGLEHTDNTPRRSNAANQNRHPYEKAVKIHV